MSTTYRLKEKYEKGSTLSLHDDDEGSAARTRPFSFEEIMLRRKKKSLSEDVKEGFVEADIISNEGLDKDASHSFESKRGYRHHKNSSPIAERHVAEETTKMSSKKKEKNTSANTNSEEYRLRRNDRRNRELESKLKARQNDYVSKEIKEGRNDKKIDGRRENDKRSTDKTQNEAEKKHSRDSTAGGSHTELSREKSERKSKRKYENGNNEKVKDSNAAKKLDTGRHYETDISGRNKKKESSKSRFEEPKLRRGRSRSRDHEERHRRSRSPSLRTHKRASYNRMAHREFASHHVKDRSEKQHHGDRNRSSNGSSSHYRRHSESTSGLGGYSPRKRITDAAAKTPSPPNQSLEKKSAKWDLAPAGTDNTLPGSIAPNLQSLISTVSTSVRELASAAPVVSISQELPSGASATALSTKSYASIDSIQLTQATRPMRRLYVENLPSSTSEKALVGWFNELLLSSGVNHIQGTQPCLSCMINQEKGQAVVEFLTPEDASAALSFDGRSISGSILKIRRPKDFVEVATGDLEKSMAAVDTITDVVKDSPNKIFIGGISEALSSKMLMDIISAFGPLKSYHFAVNDDLNEPCAFLEYVDQSVTHKACAGLNGMKLGGKVLTVVQAIPSASSLGNTGNSSLYEIPEHAKSLLKQPTQILKLKNVFDLEGFSSLSEPEIEEVLEDVRLECARFGSVKSVNVVKQGNNHTKTCQINNNAETSGFEDKMTKAENLKEPMDDEFRETIGEEFASDVKEIQEDEVAKYNRTDDDKPDNIADKSDCIDQLNRDIEIQVLGCDNVPNIVTEELNQLNSPKKLSEDNDENIASTISIDAHGSENKVKAEDNSTLGDDDSQKQLTSTEIDGSMGTESDVTERDGVKKQDFDLESILEVGCIFVEFGRTEAACMAAHCLHGRVFDDRIVTVEYVALEHYKRKFPK